MFFQGKQYNINTIITKNIEWLGSHQFQYIPAANCAGSHTFKAAYTGQNVVAYASTNKILPNSLYCTWVRISPNGRALNL